MTQQFTVVRGQIEAGKEVLATKGGIYKPHSKEEEKRLLDAGVIAPVPSAADEQEEESEGDEGDAAAPQKTAARKRGGSAEK